MPSPPRALASAGRPRTRGAAGQPRPPRCSSTAGITTTEPKARALRPYAEKLITHAKKGALHNRRGDEEDPRQGTWCTPCSPEIAPFFADRNGGYTRIIKVENRKGDNAPMAVIELVREKTVTSEADHCLRAAAAQAKEGRTGGGRRRTRRPPSSRRPRSVGNRGPGRGGGSRGRRDRRRHRPPRPRLTTPVRDAANMPAIESGGGHVHLRLDIAYDGTDFAGCGGSRASQRTVAGTIDETLSTVFRAPGDGSRGGRTDAGARQRAGRPCRRARRRVRHAYPRQAARRGTDSVPGAPAGQVPAAEVRYAKSSAPQGVRCPVLGTAPALRLPHLDGAVRRRSALARFVAAWPRAGRGGDGGVPNATGPARLRRVLAPAPAPPPSARSAAAGLGARHRGCERRDRLRQRGMRSAGTWFVRWSAPCWRWEAAGARWIAGLLESGVGPSAFATAPATDADGVTAPPDDELAAADRWSRGTCARPLGQEPAGDEIGWPGSHSGLDVGGRQMNPASSPARFRVRWGCQIRVVAVAQLDGRSPVPG